MPNRESDAPGEPSSHGNRWAQDVQSIRERVIVSGVTPDWQQKMLDAYGLPPLASAEEGEIEAALDRLVHKYGSSISNSPEHQVQPDADERSRGESSPELNLEPVSFPTRAASKKNGHASRKHAVKDSVKVVHSTPNGKPPAKSKSRRHKAQ